MSNQRPQSHVEFLHDKEKKGAKYLQMEDDGVCSPCKIWKINNNEWKLKDNIHNYNKMENKSEKKSMNFNMNSKRIIKKQKKEYTLIGKGWVDE